MAISTDPIRVTTAPLSNSLTLGANAPTRNAPLIVSQTHAVLRCQNAKMHAGRIVSELKTVAKASKVESLAPRNTNITVIRGTNPHMIPSANSSLSQSCRSPDRTSMCRHSSYQTRQLLTGTMGVPFLQPKAAAKAGWLTMTPSTRKWSGECGSVRTCERMASGREFSQ